MIIQTSVIITFVKILFIPLYHSTDFEVHRNWLAVTHSLSPSKWYYENTSEWTLDYPPFFAWLEFLLAQIAKYIDPNMLQISNMDYASDAAIIFQRFTVIVLDVIYIASIKSISKLIGNGKLLVFLLLLSSPGLLMVDHIHFQYNGFMYGLMFLSIGHMIKSNFLQSAFWFAVLLNFKHIFLYIAPVYVVHLLRCYCFDTPVLNGLKNAWKSFSLKNLMKLAGVVMVVFVMSFGPFYQHIPQIFSRLFPFKRGLSHAYWAPNIWAMYNFIDKILVHICSLEIEQTASGLPAKGFYSNIIEMPKMGLSVNKTTASMTGGLVQEFSHAVLPTITPFVTFILTVVSIIPALKHMWYLGSDRLYRGVNFVRCLIICATCSFMFGWHVHEKAILMIVIPLSFMSVLGEDDGKNFLFLSILAHYSLFPLLYPKNLLCIKLFMLFTHASMGFSFLPKLYIKAKDRRYRKLLHLPMLGFLRTTYLYGLLALCIYENLIFNILGHNKTLPFLPLMLTSVYCSVGVFVFWICYYISFLTFPLSKKALESTRMEDKKDL